MTNIPPSACALTGCSDPCYVEGYHLTDPNDGRITLHLKDGAPQAVRKLRDLNSQHCYAAKTWYRGFVGLTIFGASEVSRNIDFGDETTTMICKFVVRASDASIIKEIGSDLRDGWMTSLMVVLNTCPKMKSNQLLLRGQGSQWNG